MPDEFVALDLETTGLSLELDRITEVGATRFDRSGRSETFQTLVNPGRRIPREIQELTSITDADVAGAPQFEAVAGRLFDFIDGRPLVGQNIAFDLAFLQLEGLPLKPRTYDTWELASVLFPTAERLNLESLAALVGVSMPVAHRALADAEAARDVFLALLRRLDETPRSLLLELRAFAARAGWAVIDLLEDAIERSGGEPATIARDAAAAVLSALPPAPGRQREPVLTPAEPRRPTGPAAVAALFDLAARQPELFPAFEPRAGQREMAEAVRRTIEEGRQLAVEAGTGTGKSLAYLLPALLNALRNDDRVVISTHTLNLQDQLARHEIPLARALVETHEGASPGSLRAAVLKGRSNYLCLERWLAVREDPRPRSEAEARLFARIASWLPGTSTGDVAELYMTSAEAGAWAQVSAEGTSCLSDRCPPVRDGSCFVLRARQRAAAAHAVIVNHALLLANAARDDQLLPPFRHLVVDEAHRLEDVATGHYGATLSLRELRDLIDTLGQSERHGEPGLGFRLAHAPAAGVEVLSAYAGLSAVAADLGAAAAAARGQVPVLAEATRRFVREYWEEEGQRSEMALTAARRAQPGWEDSEEAAMQLDIALQLLARRLDAAREALVFMAADGAPGPGLEELRVLANRAADRLAAARDTLYRVILRPDREEIAWIATPEGDVRLGLAPLEVAGRLAADVFADRHSVTVTSATLSAGGSFDFSLRRLGLEDAETLEIPSPFGYRDAVLVLLVEDLPEPGMPGYERGVQEVVEAAALGAGGRTVALFTAHGALRQAAGALREALSGEEISVLAQRLDGSPTRLLRMLAARPRSLVLGAAAFWEGIDVPGEALSQIVITRLPFPVPTDPVYAGRADQFEDPFEEFAIPQAVLRFRQGFGRLIRSSSDRGVFVVADSRVLRRSYGESFLDALPDCEVRRLRADDVREAVARWLAR